jgi:murein DD-endopeptidase MepM/ murein hydrolase activator NlpD
MFSNSFLLSLQPLAKNVVEFNFQQESFVWLDLSVSNKDILNYTIDNHALLHNYITDTLALKKAKVGVGGYGEERDFYKLSPNFHTTDTPRSIHLGIDIWQTAHSPVFAVLAGEIHSFKDNSGFGNYGGTIILQHKFEGVIFYSLYGHLSCKSLQNLYKGKKIVAGEQIATLGQAHENGNWSPHLHFQLIADMANQEGDYFGVAPKHEKEKYLAICPNPNLLLNIPYFTI